MFALVDADVGHNWGTLMNTRFTMFAAAVALLAVAAPAVAQDAPRVYDQGPVVTVTYIKVEPGQLRTYMANLNGVWRRQQEEGKKRGDVLYYGVYQVVTPRPGEPDIELVVAYKNAAVMDTSLDEQDRRTAAMMGSLDAAQKATIDRGKLRTVMGGTMLRELVFKDSK